MRWLSFFWNSSARPTSSGEPKVEEPYRLTLRRYSEKSFQLSNWDPAAP